MNNKTDRAIEKTLYLLPIAIVCGFFVNVWWSNAPPTKTAIGLTISSIILVATFGALLTKEIGVRGFWIIGKSQKPGLFWAEFTVQLVLAVSILAYAYN